MATNPNDHADHAKHADNGHASHADAATALPVKEFILDNDDPKHCTLSIHKHDNPSEPGEAVYKVESDHHGKTTIHSVSSGGVLAEVHWHQLGHDKVRLEGKEEINLSDWLKSETITGKLKMHFPSIFPISLEEGSRKLHFSEEWSTSKLKLTDGEHDLVALFSPKKLHDHELDGHEGRKTTLLKPATLSLYEPALAMQNTVVVAMLVMEQKWRNTGKQTLGAGISGGAPYGATQDYGYGLESKA